MVPRKNEKKMAFNRNLAVKILKRLKLFQDGIGQICAKEFEIDRLLFGKQLQGMADHCLILEPSVSKGWNGTGVILGTLNENEMIEIIIADAGEDYLEKHDKPTASQG